MKYLFPLIVIASGIGMLLIAARISQRTTPSYDELQESYVTSQVDHIPHGATNFHWLGNGWISFDYVLDGVKYKFTSKDLGNPKRIIIKEPLK